MSRIFKLASFIYTVYTVCTNTYFFFRKKFVFLLNDLPLRSGRKTDKGEELDCVTSLLRVGQTPLTHAASVVVKGRVFLVATLGGFALLVVFVATLRFVIFERHAQCVRVLVVLNAASLKREQRIIIRCSNHHRNCRRVRTRPKSAE